MGVWIGGPRKFQFWIKRPLFFSKLDHWIKLDHRWIKLDQLDHVGSRWITLDHVGSQLDQLDQVDQVGCLTLSKVIPLHVVSCYPYSSTSWTAAS